MHVSMRVCLSWRSVTAYAVPKANSKNPSASARGPAHAAMNSVELAGIQRNYSKGYCYV